MILWLNIALTFMWIGLTGRIEASSIITGFLLSSAVLFLVYRSDPRGSRYFRKPVQILGFLLYYLLEIVRSNIIIAIDILTPRHLMKPGILAIPLEARTDFEITLLANLITMTPGTLSLDVSADRKTLFVHAMYIDDAEALRRDIKENLEKRVLAILR